MKTRGQTVKNNNNERKKYGQENVFEMLKGQNMNVKHWGKLNKEFLKHLNA